MSEQIKHNAKAFTMIELMTVIIISIIMLLGIGVYMVDIQRGWAKMLARVHSDVVSDAVIARKAFDGTARQSARFYALAPGGNGIEVNYYNDPANSTALFPDRYATFYVLENQLLVEHGIRAPKTELRTDILANNSLKLWKLLIWNVDTLFLNTSIKNSRSEGNLICTGIQYVRQALKNSVLHSPVQL